MESEIRTSEINLNKTSTFNIMSLLIIILVLLLIIFYNDRENTQNQQYLNDIYKNNITIREKFGPIINYDLKKTKINDKMFLVENFLNPEYFNYLQSQFIDKQFDTIDFYYRKGNGVNFTNLHKSNQYHGLLELYYSDEIKKVISDFLQKNVQRTPLSDNNSCSLLIYSNPGDYIDWHKDYSNYYGDRYVVLLSLINSDVSQECCSENTFLYKDDYTEELKQEYIDKNFNLMEKNISDENLKTYGENTNIYKLKTKFKQELIKEFDESKIGKIKLKPNSLLIFKGSEIFHKSTSIGLGEKRILLSMTFCDICQEKKNISYNIYESLKNYVLYG